MVNLLVDANLDGQAEMLRMRLESEKWSELRDYLDIRFLHLEDVGLDRRTKDEIVWRHCQQKGYYLLTDNRNLKSEDSLEATIRRESTEDSLPVFTLADSKRICQSTAYVDEVLDTLLEYLFDEANYRGTGRLYLP